MAAKNCSICNLRPLPSLQVRRNAGMGSDMDFCVPCFVEAGWENTHSDNAHDEITRDIAEIEAGAKVARLKEIAKSYSIKLDRTQRTIPTIKAAILASFASFTHIREEMQDCWICNPKLNQAKAEYTERTGTSRKGQVINVPLRADGATKAEIVKTRIGELGEVKIKTQKDGSTNLLAYCGEILLVLRWDDRGRYLYAESSIVRQGKSAKVRNVSEAFRVLGV